MYLNTNLSLSLAHTHIQNLKTESTANSPASGIRLKATETKAASCGSWLGLNCEKREDDTAENESEEPVLVRELKHCCRSLEGTESWSDTRLSPAGMSFFCLSIYIIDE